MAVKTTFSNQDFTEILARYDLGGFIQAAAISEGTVQTNFLVHTDQGQFVFRYYENRAKESVLFERDLLTFLSERQYPCPTPYQDRQGVYVGLHQDKPYMLFPFMSGHHIEEPNAQQRQQMIQKVAELQQLTIDFQSPYIPYRWNYEPALVLTLAQAEAAKLDTANARAKLAWLAEELSALQLPASLPKCICHADFHWSNILFEGDQFVALLDFDDANYTYSQFDLVCLVESWAWPPYEILFNSAQARPVVQEYMRHRPLSPSEQQSMIEVHKLSILIDCVWFFGRGSVDDFYEKRKIDSLKTLGWRQYCDALFH